MKRLLLTLAALSIIVLPSRSVVFADVPSLLSYQAHVSDTLGIPLDTTVVITFTIYDDSTGGSSVWSETQPSVDINEGLFQVLLGSVNPIEDTVFNSEERWLGISIGAAPELNPRTQIVSSAYAQRVATVDGATGGDIKGTTKILDDSSDVVLNLREGPNSGAGQILARGPNSNLNAIIGTTTNNPDHGGIAVYDERGEERATLWIPSHGTGMVTTNGANGSFNVRLSSLSGYPNNGYIAVRDSLNITKIGMYASSYGNGRIHTFGPNGYTNIALSNWAGDQNAGFLAVINSEDTLVAGAWAGPSGRGIVSVWGPNATSNVHLTSLNDLPENGHVGVYDSTSWAQGAVYVDSADAGIVFTRGPNRNRNVRLMYLENHPNNGYVSVWDANDTIQAGMFVDTTGDGVIFADVKNFRMVNPADKSTEIWYACIEGPEAGAYLRGTGHLVNGQAVITYEDHFSNVASPRGMTIQLTPLSAESRGLAVVEKNPGGFTVAELNNGKGTYDFDFMVMAVRKGYEDYRVIRPAGEARPASPELEPAPVGRETLIDRASPSQEASALDAESNRILR